jgi:hypothetical protein
MSDPLAVFVDLRNFTIGEFAPVSSHEATLGLL